MLLHCSLILYLSKARVCQQQLGLVLLRTVFGRGVSQSLWLCNLLTGPSLVGGDRFFVPENILLSCHYRLRGVMLGINALEDSPLLLRFCRIHLDRCSRDRLIEIEFISETEGGASMAEV